jgi:hypothetical protein
MPRQTSSHKTSAPAPAPAPASVSAPAPPQPNLASTMLQGFSFGAGQSLAYNTFRSDPKEVKEVKETKEPNPKNLSNCIKNEECNKLLESFLNMEFIHCIKDNKYEDCKHLI